MISTVTSTVTSTAMMTNKVVPTAIAITVVEKGDGGTGIAVVVVGSV